MKPRFTIIIRSKNEEKWIKACLSSVFSQSLKDFEIFLVDNNSTDTTVNKAKEYGVKKVLFIDDYLPGKAINLGVEIAQGEFIVLLSAHCVPTSKDWLKNLYSNFEADKGLEVAGVYGRQEALSSTDDLDKRDLITTFGLDRRVQVKDSFFHNANSMIRRSVLDKIPIDSTVTNIEDRVWGKQAIESGYKLVYEPQASVYHYHGIHQGADRLRAKNVIRIIESITEPESSFEKNFKMLKYNVSAIIVTRGKPQIFCNKSLVEFSIDNSQRSDLITDVYVATDNEQMRDIALAKGAKVPFLRPKHLSSQSVGVEEVLQYYINKLDELETYPDIVVYLSPRYPFRIQEHLDRLIQLLITRGFDSVMAGLPTYKSCWVMQNDFLKRIDEGFINRGKKQPIHVAYAGLGCVTFTGTIREGKLLGDKVGILEVLDSYSTLEVESIDEYSLAEKVFPDWWGKNNPLSKVLI